MLRGGNQNQRVFHERLGFHVHPFRRLAHEDHVDAVGLQQPQQLFPIGDIKLQTDPRIALMKNPQQPWREIVDGARNRHRKTAAANALERRHHLFHVLKRPVDAAAVMVDLAPGLREADGLAELLEQGETNLVLELAHLH